MGLLQNANIMKIAIVHDYLHQFGGAERVVAILHEMFPMAPIYTSIFNPKNFPKEFNEMNIITSFMQKLPFIFDNFRMYFLIYPFVFSSFNLQEYDLIISSSSAYAKGIKKRKEAVHVCYCHNPMRFVWRYENYMEKENLPIFFKNILPFLLNGLKNWDLKTNDGVDLFVANSNIVKERIARYYKRNSIIIYPPIDTNRFCISQNDGNYFLVVSRLAAYKRIDIAVKAFSKLKLPLKIVGDGPAREELSKYAASNIEFLGKVSDDKAKRLFSECRALILCGEEDFGMTPLEAAASGRPTIAYKAGGALETVIEGQTGVFFDEQTEESLIGAIKRFETIRFDKNMLRLHSEKFDKEIFKEDLRRFLNENKIF